MTAAEVRKLAERVRSLRDGTDLAQRRWTDRPPQQLNGRQGRVFSVRLTSDEADVLYTACELQRQAERDSGSWWTRHTPIGVGTFMREAALALAATLVPAEKGEQVDRRDRGGGRSSTVVPGAIAPGTTASSRRRRKAARS